MFKRFFVYNDFDNLRTSLDKSPFAKFTKLPYKHYVMRLTKPIDVNKTLLLVCLQGRLLASNSDHSIVVDRPIAIKGQYRLTPVESEVLFYIVEVNDEWEQLVERLPVPPNADLADVVIAAD